LGETTCRSDLPDLAGIGFGEPEVAIRSVSNAEWAAARRRYQKMRDCTRWSDLTDTVGTLLGEPEVAVGAARDRIRHAAARQWKLREQAVRCHSPDSVRLRLAEPEIPVRPAAQLKGIAVGSG